MAKSAPEALTKALKAFEEVKESHEAFVRKVEKRYRSYRGVLDRRSPAAQWTSKLHPPYVFQIVETIVANMIDDKIKFGVRPRPRVSDPADIEKAKRGAHALEVLLRYEHDIDRFVEKQRPFALQAAITGLTVGKCFWDFHEGVEKRLERQYRPLSEDLPLLVPGLAEVEAPQVLRDDPTFEVVDVRDFMVHEAAVNLETAQYCFHRVWFSYEELERLQEQGIYQNVAQLKETRDFSEEYANRERELFEVNRTKDMIEVLEWWTNDRVVTIANRDVLLRDKPNPFWHGQKPFVIASTAPDLFRIPGISDVEIVEQLQEMLWTVANQRLDNLALLNNAISIIRSDVDDPDAFEYAPGERWLVDDIDQVKWLEVNPIPAEISIRAEEMLKGDLQNITGGMPFMAGTETQSIDQETATGISIVTNLAQKRLAAKKQNFAYAFKRKAEFDISLLQQFVREDRLVQIVGKDGALDFLAIKPDEIQGRFVVEVATMAESLMRQERRAEAQALLTMAMQLAPVAMAVQTPINLRAYIEDFLRAFDVDDLERYFSAQPQPNALGLPGGPGGAPGAPPEGGGGPNLGITASQASDAGSPSNATSQSPEVMLQRALAMRGGANNAG